MSEPFGDNPFGEPQRVDIFDDKRRGGRPQTSGTGESRVQVGVLDDFNPFSEQNETVVTVPQPNNQKPITSFPPATISVTNSNDPPPQYAATPHQKILSDDLDRRQKELEAKAAELQRREQEQLRRENLANAPQPGERRNNFPPLPSFISSRCAPCFYQDFDVDIPPEYRRIVRIIYLVWIIYSVVLFLNIWSCLAYFISDPSNNVTGTTFGLSILLFVLLTPLSYCCWFRPLYKAFRSDSSLNFFVFFIIYLVQIILVVIQALGINWLASSGWINGLATLGKNTVVAAIMLVMAALFSAIAFAKGFLLIKVHRFYRRTGQSLARAKQEFSSDVANSAMVREAASEIGSAAARNAVNNASAKF